VPTRARRFEHRALQLGVSLSLAHMACDDKHGAFDVLREVLQQAQRSGASRTALDFGEDVRVMLPRFLVSDQRDPPLVPCVQRLIAGNGVAASEAAADALNAVTERERRVLALVALDHVNRRAKLTPYRRPKLTPLTSCTPGSARPGGAGWGCAAGASAVA